MNAPTRLDLAEPMVTVATRLPEQISSLIDRMAHNTMRSRSDIMRSLLVAKLIDTGHVAPPSIDDLRVAL